MHEPNHYAPTQCDMAETQVKDTDLFAGSFGCGGSCHVSNLESLSCHCIVLDSEPSTALTNTVGAA